MSRERELIGLLRSEFPLLDDDGLDENEHHCEWAIQQDRKRLHALLADLSLQAEPAPAQDEREAFEARMRLGGYSNPEKHPDGSYVSSAMELWWQGWKARATRPSQTALSAVTAERDRLLSDNASLRGSCKALGEENKQLKRENKRQGRTIAAMAAKEA